MTERMRRSLVLGLVVVALPVMAAASPAVAKKAKNVKLGPVVTTSQTVSGSGNQTILTAAPSCPKGTRAVGGGYSSTPPSSMPSVNSVIYESRKVGQTGWRVSLQIGDASAPDNVFLTASVYCRRGAPTTSLASLVTTLPAVLGMTPATAATCEGKAKAFGGGFATQPPVLDTGAASAFVFESFPSSPTSWTTRALTTNNASAGILTTEAYCAKTSAKKPKKSASASGKKKKKKGLRPPITSSVTSPPTLATQGSSTFAAATCPSRSVIGGGFAQPTATFPAPPRTGYVFESQRNGSSWRVSALATTDLVITVDSIALCG